MFKNRLCPAHGKEGPSMEKNTPKDPPLTGTLPVQPVIALPRTIHLVPLDRIAGFDVRPGLYEINGATAIPGGVNFIYPKGCRTVSEIVKKETERV